MTFILALLFGLLIVGGMLLSRLMAFTTIFDFWRTVDMEKKFFDMYEDAKEEQRNRRP